MGQQCQGCQDTGPCQKCPKCRSSPNLLSPVFGRKAPRVFRSQRQQPDSQANECNITADILLNAETTFLVGLASAAYAWHRTTTSLSWLVAPLFSPAGVCLPCATVKSVVSAVPFSILHYMASTILLATPDANFQPETVFYVI